MSASPSLLAPPSPLEIRSLDLVRLRPYAATVGFVPRRQVATATTGGFRAPLRGRGMDFEESRLYQPGDDIRTMDWRVTARRGEPHTKVFRPERERPVVLLVDVGSSMAFGTRRVLKSVLAGEVAALLAWMAVERGDRVGAVVHADERIAELPPANRALGALRLFRLLERMQVRPAERVVGRATASSVDAGLARLARRARAGSLLFLLGDYWGLGEAGERHLEQCTRYCEVVLALIHDPIEAELPAAGEMVFTSGREHRLLRADVPEVRALFVERFVRHVERLGELLARRGGRLITLSTAEPAVRTLGPALRGPAGAMPRATGTDG